jgi:hypothetical protein
MMRKREMAGGRSGREKFFAYWGVWEGARMKERVLDSICIS